MSFSFSSRNLHNAFVPGQLVQRCIIHSWFDGSHTTSLTRFLYVASKSRASTNKMVFWWVVQTHTECASDEPAMTHHLGQTVQNLEKPIFTSGFLSLNATNNYGDCTELTAFVFEHLSVCLHNPFSWEAVSSIHHPHRKHEQDQVFLRS